MNRNITIETLQAEDVGAVTALLNTLVPWHIPQEDAQAAFQKMMEKEESAVFIAKENGLVIGTATAICCQALAAKFLVIEDVIVHPDRTGQGIGSMLMHAVDTFAIDRKCHYGILVSSGHRTLAHTFYRKCGFTEDVRGFRKGYC